MLREGLTQTFTSTHTSETQDLPMLIGNLRPQPRKGPEGIRKRYWSWAGMAWVTYMTWSLQPWRWRSRPRNCRLFLFCHGLGGCFCLPIIGAYMCHRPFYQGPPGCHRHSLSEANKSQMMTRCSGASGREAFRLGQEDSLVYLRSARQSTEATLFGGPSQVRRPAVPQHKAAPESGQDV